MRPTVIYINLFILLSNTILAQSKDQKPLVKQEQAATIIIESAGKEIGKIAAAALVGKAVETEAVQTALAKARDKVIGAIGDAGIPIVSSAFDLASDSKYLLAATEVAMLVDSINADIQTKKNQRRVNLNKYKQGIETTSVILNSMTQLYKAYQTMIDYTEATSEVIRTAYEIKEIADYISKISDLYEQYGVTYKIEDLYYFDDYLNPNKQRYHYNNMKSIYDRAQDISKAAVRAVRKDNPINASDSWRLREIRNINYEAHQLLSAIYMNIWQIEAMNKVNINQEKEIDIKQSLYDIEHYDNYRRW